MSSGDLVVVLLAVALGATMKSVTGMGLPIIAIPIISVVTDPELAVAVLAIPNAAQNLVMAFRHRQHLGDTVGLAPMVVAGIAGAALGAAALGAVPSEVVLGVLILLVSAYLVNSVRAPRIGLAPSTARRWAPVAGFVSGVFQGGAGISGPIVGTWHHALRLPRGAFVLSVSSVFLLAGITQTAVFATNGLLTGRLAVSVLLTVLVLATIPLGSRLSGRLSGPGFDRAVLGLLAISLVALTIDLVTSFASGPAG